MFRVSGLVNILWPLACIRTHLLINKLVDQAMFTGGLMECGMTRVKLQGVSPTAMAKIILFMYTGTIRVTELTVCHVLPAATMLQVCSIIHSYQLLYNLYSIYMPPLNLSKKVQQLPSKYGTENGKQGKPSKLYQVPSFEINKRSKKESTRVSQNQNLFTVI